jgi:hypothetical protein
LSWEYENPKLKDHYRAQVAVVINALAKEQPEYLSGCLHPGNEPNSCQHEGQCLSAACNHNGKTWRAPRMTVLAQDPNVLYPNRNQGE